MNYCRASSRARLRGRRNSSTALTRLTGVAILLMAATVWPMAVFAADPAVDTQNNAAVVFVVIVLLVGSVTAGLFFASPLRRRFEAAEESKPADVPPGAPEPGRMTQQPPATFSQPSVYVQRVAPSILGSVYAEAVIPTAPPAMAQQPPFPGLQPMPARAPLYGQAVTIQPMTPVQPSRPIQPMTPVQPSRPIQPMTPVQPPTPVQSLPAAQHRPAATPWSTGSPQADLNWNPERRRVRPEPGF